MKGKFWVNLISAVTCAVLGVGLIVFNRTTTARQGLRTADETRRAVVILVVAIVLGVVAVALGTWVIMVYFRRKNEQDRALLAELEAQGSADDQGQEVDQRETDHPQA